MVNKNDSKNFIKSLYNIINNKSNDNVVEWFKINDKIGFRINDIDKFVKLLIKEEATKSIKYASIARQLNLYRFNKMPKSKINFWFNKYFYKDSEDIDKIKRLNLRKKLNILPLKNTNKRVREIIADEIIYVPKNKKLKESKKIDKSTNTDTIQINNNNNNILKITEDFLMFESNFQKVLEYYASI